MAASLEDKTHEEQRAVIRFLTAEDIKPSEVYRRMSSQYVSSCLNQRNVYIWIERRRAYKYLRCTQTRKAFRGEHT